MSEIEWRALSPSHWAGGVEGRAPVTILHDGTVYHVYCVWIDVENRYYPECAEFKTFEDAQRAAEDAYAIAKVGGLI